MSEPLPAEGERVLDASVLLSAIKREVGVGDLVLECGVVSAVNWSETVQKLHQVDHWVEGVGGARRGGGGRGVAVRRHVGLRCRA